MKFMKLDFKLKHLLIFVILCFFCYQVLWIWLDLLTRSWKKHPSSKSNRLPPKDPNLKEYVKQMEVGLNPNATLLNHPDYKFIINNPNRCNSIKEKEMFDANRTLNVVILVKSAVSNFEKRATIRQLSLIHI